MPIHFLIVDGYSPAGREAYRTAGMSAGSAIYARMLTRWLPEAEHTVWAPRESLRPPAGPEAFDAVLWTGSDLNAYDRGNPLVRTQVEFAAASYGAGTPGFGSCWGLQVNAKAAGGEVVPNPRGREIGVARHIQITPEGRNHPMLAGKPAVFDNFSSHLDEVAKLPPGAIVLAGNEFTRVQAIEITQGRGSFWGVQYHPEYDLYDVARLIASRARRLCEEEFFRDPGDAARYVEQLEALHQEPGRKDLRWQLDIGDDLISAEIRQLEFRNWLKCVALPRAGRA